MRIALTALTPAGPRDVVVTGDDSATVREVAAGLRAAQWPNGRMAEVIRLPAGGDRRAAAAAAGTAWVDGRALDPDSPAAAGLRDGAIVAVDSWSAPATALAEPAGVVEVRTVGGPAAGRVHRLGFGAAIIGAAPDCHVQLGGARQPDRAARVVVERGAGALIVTVEPLPGAGSVAPVLDSEPLTGQQPWSPGGLLTIGSSVLTLAQPEPPDAHLSPGDDGGLAFNRPPRLLPPDLRRRIEVPAEPRRAEKVRLQLISAVIPLLLGAVMIKVLHSAVYALFMLMSPVMVVGQWMSDRRHGRTSHQKAMREYRRRMAELDGVIAAQAVADQVARREASPDPAEVLLTATGPRRRLWERRADDPDALELRIGLADQPAMVELVPEADGTKRSALPAPPLARDVPVTLPLASLGVIGLAGPLPASRGLARWLVAQAAVLHSPRDLQIVVLSTDPQAGQEWNWVRWLPHAAPRGSAACIAEVGTDPESAARRVAELAAEAGERLSRAGGSTGLLASYGSAGPTADPGLGPRILIVLDGARLLRRLPGMPQVLSAARAAGMQAICLDESRRLLPEECAAVISWDDDVPPAVTVQGGGLDQVGRVLADQVGTDWADRVARSLAPVRDVSREDADSALPASARLLDLLRMPNPGADDICAGWQQAGRSTGAVVGVGADGPFRLDLAADGPHGLIAGTTGSGKSELLQTIIASLAVANRPDSMTFVLIDYKGGSAFKDCARLPHTVGMVTDLDGHLTERALASLGAELRRREEILRDAGAKDIEDYWDARRLSPQLPPMPRLVLVIDEFASLVAELPEFVSGLVGIAQRGRSLGVHLLLATQRPAGVVSADIRANTNLRIALRVTDGEESADVIDTRDAAFISRSTPGRCYVRSGVGSPAAVQSARIGGRRPGTGPAGAAARVIPVPWADLGRPLPAGPAARADEDLVTDLSVLVDTIAGAAVRLGIPAQRSPWLAPLPEVVTLGDLPQDEAAGPGQDIGPVALPYGLVDVPSRQAREPLLLDLAHGGHLVIAGAARTGRSTALRSIAGSVAAGTSPADVHLYAIDCAAGAMLPLA
ncbi:MAG TPA: FtsK/SpoIIIE domain-containing protein, partial [Streptosporangiaceae bacterium]